MPPTSTIRTPPSSNNAPLHTPKSSSTVGNNNMPSSAATIPVGTPSSSPPPSPSSTSPFGSFSTTSNLNTRSVFLLAAFIVFIVQMHLMFDRILNYNNNHSMNIVTCHENHAHNVPPTIIYKYRDRNITQIQYIDKKQQQQRQEKEEENTATAENLLSGAITTTGTTGTASIAKLQHQKELPSITDQGMIIIFLHVPKTGGTTMSEPFVHNPEWRYRMVYGPKKQANYSIEMTETLQNWQPGTKIFYEYHGGRAAPYMDFSVRDDMQHWRSMAKLRNIPFFAFTVFREPLSFAVSHFNFYYANRQKDDNRYYYVPNPTEEDFIELSLPNPQCLFCVSSEVAYYKEWRQDKHKTIHVPKEGCAAVYQAFVEDLDWVGTTETLSSQTFPMIEQIANVKFESHLKNKSKDKIKKGNLTQEALAHIRNITSYDNDIYQRAKEDFPIEMWSNFHVHSNSLQQQ